MNKTHGLYPRGVPVTVINVLNIPLIKILTTIYYRPGNVLSFLNAVSHLIFPIILGKIYPLTF